MPSWPREGALTCPTKITRVRLCRFTAQEHVVHAGGSPRGAQEAHNPGAAPAIQEPDWIKTVDGSTVCPDESFTWPTARMCNAAHLDAYQQSIMDRQAHPEETEAVRAILEGHAPDQTAVEPPTSAAERNQIKAQLLAHQLEDVDSVVAASQLDVNDTQGDLISSHPSGAPARAHTKQLRAVRLGSRAAERTARSRRTRNKNQMALRVQVLIRHNRHWRPPQSGR